MRPAAAAFRSRPYRALQSQAVASPSREAQPARLGEQHEGLLPGCAGRPARQSVATPAHPRKPGEGVRPGFLLRQERGREKKV